MEIETETEMEKETETETDLKIGKETDLKIEIGTETETGCERQIHDGSIRNMTYAFCCAAYFSGVKHF